METTGHRLTKAYIGFYDFQKLQGKYLGYFAKFIGYRGVTHVGLILETETKEFHYTICSGSKSNDGTLSSNCKIFTLHTLEKLGAILIDKIEMPIPDGATLRDATIEATSYTEDNAWDLIFHIFIGRFLGLTRPRNCVTHVCRFFNLPDCFLPADLYRKYYDNNLTVRSSQSWKDNCG